MKFVPCWVAAWLEEVWHMSPAGWQRGWRCGTCPLLGGRVSGGVARVPSWVAVWLEVWHILEVFQCVLKDATKVDPE